MYIRLLQARRDNSGCSNRNGSRSNRALLEDAALSALQAEGRHREDPERNGADVAIQSRAPLSRSECRGKLIIRSKRHPVKMPEPWRTSSPM